MVNYTSSASIGAGRFAPSVQYNTPVRMPTQPMPDMPDVRSEFNIDLRPIGQAMLGIKELETKSLLAEKEMEMKRDIAAQELLANKAIKEQEWVMKQQQHQDKMDLGYAKLAKEEQKNLLKTTEMNNALTRYNKGIDVLETELRDNNLTYEGFETEKRKLFDEISASLQHNTIGSFSDNINKIRPGAGSVKTAFMSDLEANAEKARETDATQNANTISNVSENLRISIPEATRKVEATKDSYARATQYLQNAVNPPSLVREEQKDSYIKAQIEAADRELGVVGGAKVVYDYMKNVNVIHNMRNPAEGVEMLRQSFYTSLEGLNVDAPKKELLWNIYRRTNNLDQLIENTMNLSKAVSDNDKTYITRAIDAKRIDLIDDKIMGDFFTVIEAAPFIKDAFVNAPQNFEKITSLTNAVVQANMVDAKPVDGGWQVSLSNGTSLSISEPEALRLMNETGTDNISDALLATNIRAANNARMKGDREKATRIATKGVDYILSQKAQNPEDAINKAANLDTALQNVDLRYLEDEDENAVLKSAHAKILSRYGKGGFTDLSGKIAYLVPDTVWNDWVKGGELYVWENSDGTLGLHREQYGVFGGAGRKDWKEQAMAVSKMMSDAGLTPKEQITMIRTALQDDSKLFKIMEKDWKISVWERAKIGLQAIIGTPLHYGAVLDSKVIKYATLLAKADSAEEVKEVFGMMSTEAKESFVQGLKNTRDNKGNPEVVREIADTLLNLKDIWKGAGDVSYRKVGSLAEAEKAIAEDSKRKVKPAEPVNDIETTVSLPINAVKKESIEPVEMSVEGIEDDEIIAIVDY